MHSPEHESQYKFQPFGSSVSGLALDNSDFDIAFFPEKTEDESRSRAQTISRFKSILQLLTDQTIRFGDRKYGILKKNHPLLAKFPITLKSISMLQDKGRFQLTTFRDENDRKYEIVTTSNAYQTTNTEYIRRITQLDKEIFKLLLCLKMVFKLCNLQTPKRFTSYAICITAITFLQNSGYVTKLSDLQPNYKHFDAENLKDFDEYINWGDLSYVNDKLCIHTDENLLRECRFDTEYDNNLKILKPIPCYKKLINEYFEWFIEFLSQNSDKTPVIDSRRSVILKDVSEIPDYRQVFKTRSYFFTFKFEI